MVSTADTARSTARRRRVILWALAGLAALGADAIYARRAALASLELDEAEAALRRNDAIAARFHAERALARRPNEERGLLLAARAARRSNASADAERFLTELDGGSKSTDASRFEWALLGVQQGDFGDDEDRLRIAVGRNHPEEIAILEALAKGYAAAFRWSDALAALARLLDRDPDHIPGLILRAAISERFRRVDEAEVDLRRAVTSAPDNAAAHTAFAGLKNHRGRTREAIFQRTPRHGSGWRERWPTPRIWPEQPHNSMHCSPPTRIMPRRCSNAGVWNCGAGGSLRRSRFSSAPLAPQRGTAKLINLI